MAVRQSDPTGLHRVLDDAVVLPQAAQRLDTRRELWPDEVRIRVQRLNLDAASYRQLERTHTGDDGARRHRRDPRRGPRHRRERAARCRTPRPAPAACSSAPSRRSARARRSACAVGDRVATLVSLTLTPLVIEDGLAGWDGAGEQVPCDGYAVLFGRSIAAVLPDDLDPALSLVGDGRLRRTGAHRARRRAGTTPPRSRSSAAAGSPAR